MCIRYGHKEASDRLEAREANKSKPSKRRYDQRRPAYCEVGILGPMQKLPTSSVAIWSVLKISRSSFLRQLAEDLRDVLFPIRGRLSQEPTKIAISCTTG